MQVCMTKSENFQMLTTLYRRIKASIFCMGWNAAGQTLLWISAIAWLETDSEQLVRFKSAGF